MARVALGADGIDLARPTLALSHYDDAGRRVRVPRARMRGTPAAVRRGDRVGVVLSGDRAVFSEPVRGRTLLALVAALERGLGRTRRFAADDVDTRRAVLAHIGTFLRAADVNRLTALYTGRGLTARDLIGDYRFLEGEFRRQSGGLWVYGLGS